MKQKRMFCILAYALLLLAAACTPAPAQPEPSAPAQTQPTEPVTVMQPVDPTNAPDPTEAPATAIAPLQAADADALTAILTDLGQSYFPGTAGCSLTAAKFAGRLLDWNAALSADASDITRVAAAYYAGLDPEAAAQLVTQQIGDIYAAAKALLEQNAEDYLEAAGYEPESYPWPEQAVSDLFTALYAGFDVALPE